MSREIRRLRQRDTIVALAAAGELDRATALLAEHLIEFPDDEVASHPILGADRLNSAT